MKVAYQSGTPVQPKVKAGNSLLPIPAPQCVRPFWLFHQPLGWLWSEDHGWRPRLAPVQYMEGVNGTTQRNGVVQPQKAKMGLASKDGAVVIEANDRRIQDPTLRQWLCEAQTTSGLAHHHCVWESYRKIGNRVKSSVNDELLNRFTDHLLETGIIPPMDEDALDIHLDVLDQTMNRDGIPDRKREALQAKRDAMVKSYDDQFRTKTKAK